jgi:FkbM family methyltransferase
MTNIPIIIICYNNYRYVDNTLKQLNSINLDFDVRILNNNSTCQKTIEFLKTKNNVIHNNKNEGPWIREDCNKSLYDSLPDLYIATDPDLQFNENLPKDFIDTLCHYSEKYNAYKVGFALKLDDYDKMYKGTYYVTNKCKEKWTIHDWEKRFWLDEVESNVYRAPIDTTFCLTNKKYKDGGHLRIGGNFTCVHIPWYIENSIYNPYENYVEQYKQTGISSSTTLIKKYFEDTYLKVIKNDEFFLISRNMKSNFAFWNNCYTKWEKETFDVFDQHLSKDKIFIDIGAWVGTTCMYGSRKSKYVYSVEADNLSFGDLTINMKNNCENNYKLINNAIYNKSNVEMKFGKNLNLKNARMNDSTSQLYIDGSSDQYTTVKTITINDIIKDIDKNDISLIKIDIEGGEEHILEDVVKLGIKSYISFHYDWWVNKDLDRFDFLSTEIKNKIKKNPFISLLF